MIRVASCSNSTVSSFFEKSQKSMSLGFNDKINRECVIRPSSNITATTPDVVVANAI